MKRRDRERLAFAMIAGAACALCFTVGRASRVEPVVEKKEPATAQAPAEPPVMVVEPFPKPEETSPELRALIRGGLTPSGYVSPEGVLWMPAVKR